VMITSSRLISFSANKYIVGDTAQILQYSRARTKLLSFLARRVCCVEQTYTGRKQQVTFLLSYSRPCERETERNNASREFQMSAHQPVSFASGIAGVE
jgi:hypothetical protein